MPALDNCVNFAYEPGAIPASPGATPVIPIIPTFEDPENYDPATVQYSYDFSKFWNAMYLPTL